MDFSPRFGRFLWNYSYFSYGYEFLLDRFTALFLYYIQLTWIHQICRHLHHYRQCQRHQNPHNLVLLKVMFPLDCLYQMRISLRMACFDVRLWWQRQRLYNILVHSPIASIVQQCLLQKLQVLATFLSITMDDTKQFLPAAVMLRRELS